MVSQAQVTLPLVVRDLTMPDLPGCGWAGGPGHVASVAAALRRAAGGEVDYLAVFLPSGRPVALCGVDYVPVPGAGILWQVAVHEALQSCGIGTVLIRAAEARIRGQGRRRAELRVEESNPRARVLYERLGYAACGREAAAWDQAGPDGTVHRYETMCTVMRRDLGG
jgi:GNAT superfamily N-acetyltransferase